MAHVNWVKLIEVSKEKISLIFFYEAHVNVWVPKALHGRDFRQGQEEILKAKLLRIWLRTKGLKPKAE